jgi:hypothetical protein
MTVDAGQGGGCLNFVAEIHRMPEYPWQYLDFRGTGHPDLDRPFCDPGCMIGKRVTPSAPSDDHGQFCWLR